MLLLPVTLKFAKTLYTIVLMLTTQPVVSFYYIYAW